MKNTLNKIYLQLVSKEYEGICKNSKEMGSKSIFCHTEKMYQEDLEFISVDFISARIKELEQEFSISDKKIELHRAITELRNLIK